MLWTERRNDSASKQSIALIDRRTITDNSKTMEQWLLQWDGLPLEKVTRETLASLEGKVVLEGGKDDTVLPTTKLAN